MNPLNSCPRNIPRGFGLMCSLLLGLLAGCGPQAEYPARPITLIVPWAVGGGTDRVARQTAAFLEQDLGTPVNVVNATGGQGVVGHSRGLNAAPDGYTLTMMTLELNMLHWRGLTSLTWDDCAPLMSINEDPAAIFVPAQSDLKSIRELEARVRSQPGQLKASGTANLAAWHLALSGWLIACDLKPDAIVWVPSQGSAPALQELLSGGLDLVCCSLPEAASLLDSGDLRCLGVMSEARMTLPQFAKYPTLKEQGTDWTLTGWRALGVPRDTPPAIKEKLTASLRRIMSGERQVSGQTFVSFMDAQGFDHTTREDQPLRDFLKDNDALFGRLMSRPELALTGPVGPMAFPLVAGLLLVGSLGTVVSQTLRTRRATPTVGEDGPLSDPHTTLPDPTVPPDRLARARFVLVPALVGLYAGASATMGFILTSALIVLTLSLSLRARWRVAVPVSVLASVGMYQLFAVGLRVALPIGWFGW